MPRPLVRGAAILAIGALIVVPIVFFVLPRGESPPFDLPLPVVVESPTAAPAASVTSSPSGLNPSPSAAITPPSGNPTPVPSSTRVNLPTPGLPPCPVDTRACEFTAIVGRALVARDLDGIIAVSRPTDYDCAATGAAGPPSPLCDGAAAGERRSGYPAGDGTDSFILSPDAFRGLVRSWVDAADSTASDGFGGGGMRAFAVGCPIAPDPEAEPCKEEFAAVYSGISATGVNPRASRHALVFFVQFTPNIDAMRITRAIFLSVVTPDDLAYLKGGANGVGNFYPWNPEPARMTPTPSPSTPSGSASPQPSGTPSGTPGPSTTPDAVPSPPSATPQASATPGGRFAWGALVQLANLDGEKLCVRSQPAVDRPCSERNQSENWLATLEDGDTGVIVGGPVIADGYTWWSVLSVRMRDRAGAPAAGVGWVAEGNGAESWLMNIAPAALNGGWRARYTFTSGPYTGQAWEYTIAIHQDGSGAAALVNGPGTSNKLFTGAVSTDGAFEGTDGYTRVTWVLDPAGQSFRGRFSDDAGSGGNLCAHRSELPQSLCQ